jgi:hypothetical protein
VFDFIFFLFVNLFVACWSYSRAVNPRQTLEGLYVVYILEKEKGLGRSRIEFKDNSIG